MEIFKKETYVIMDWAGNILFKEKQFQYFEDAWGFLYETFPDEEDFSEFEVVPKSTWDLIKKRTKL